MMNQYRSPLRRIVGFTALAVVTLAVAGCSKKVTSVDSGFTAPEGQYSERARLAVYADLPITVETWADLTPEGPDPNDTLQTVEPVFVMPGAIHGMILDGTPASGYQVLRREGNGGYAQLKDYVLNPVARYLDSQWELYAFADGRPSGFSPPSYVGRGVVAGAVTLSSPLTNTGQLTGQTIATLQYTGSRSPRDSNITMQWERVPGAEGYWIQIFQFQGGSEQLLLSARPAPLVTEYVRNYFVGYVRDTVAATISYKLGDPGALVLTRRPLLTGIEYLVRISAVDAQGRMIAFTTGDFEYLRALETYRRYRLGSVKVMPRR